MAAEDVETWGDKRVARRVEMRSNQKLASEGRLRGEYTSIISTGDVLQDLILVVHNAVAQATDGVGL